jgi:cation diffusion facilitator CzcD-associated flavoprotein CzcO
MRARILTDLTQLTFDRVDRVKVAVGEVPLKGDDRLWILGQDFQVLVTDDHQYLVRVAAGFVTDGASVPYLAQLVTGWRPWDEPHRWGAIVHDWLYCMNGTWHILTGEPASVPKAPKALADRAFRATLMAAGASRFRATVMYWAVRLFGGPAYRSDQQTGPTIRA